MLPRVKKVGWLTVTLACAEVVNPNCTTIGCLTGLAVSLSGDFPAEFTLRLDPGSPAPWEVDCTPATCVGVLDFEGFLPESVLVEIEANGALLFQQRFDPAYAQVFPNGPHCDDGCTQATIDVTL